MKVISLKIPEIPNLFISEMKKGMYSLAFSNKLKIAKYLYSHKEVRFK